MPLRHRESLDYDRLMREYPTRVFNERDSNTRLKAIQEIYADGRGLSGGEGHGLRCNLG
ncbi:MAG: hypothetical protein PW789_03850 [Edaphobacter sp.]|uniref:hypothetical protein n=1 Tax=Edaphobacter sp. TaxID=1934404 RepID=UPI00238CB8EE|nr:hypothetical protein [Edaphobacter sp.]MDE1175719.1 hypothetical protein [Edaphobacter sp.]